MLTELQTLVLEHIRQHEGVNREDIGNYFEYDRYLAIKAVEYLHINGLVDERLGGYYIRQSAG